MERLYPAYLKTGTEEVVLSENALAILKLQAEGLSVAQIAKRLHIQEGTVKYHSSQTYQKLGVKGKSGAVAEAYRRGLIKIRLKGGHLRRSQQLTGSCLGIV